MSGSNQPLIAIPSGVVVANTTNGWPIHDTLTIPASIAEAVQRAGGLPAVLAPSPVTSEQARRLLARFDGLLLIGGPDVDPVLYGEDPHPAVYGVRRERDELEIALSRAAIEREMPVLAICRGIQVLNVALGGTLDQHITDREGLQAHGIPRTRGHVQHDVRLRPGCRTALVMGSDKVSGSSHHHQALARLADGLEATGWAEDGTIEAAESANGLIVAVQWHPEDTAAEDPAQQRLFDDLVQAASTRAWCRPR